MFIELLDVLRCVRPHDDSWLVGSFDVLVDRHILQGTLGCPVCGANYPIVGGVAHFTEPPPATPASAAPPDDSVAGLRLAAMLGLAEPGGVALLTGRWTSLANEVGAIASQVPMLLVNPVGALPPFASAATARGALPVASGSIRAIAWDAEEAGGIALESCVRALRPGGRLVAAASVPLPPEVSELARDTHHWVAQRDAAPATGPVLRLTRRK